MSSIHKLTEKNSTDMGLLPCAGQHLAVPVDPETSITGVLAYGRHSSLKQNPVSAADQNVESIVWARAMLGVNESRIHILEFTDEAVMGSKVARDGLTKAVAATKDNRHGIFIVESISRLGRTVKLCVDTINEIVNNGWRFISRKEGIDTDSAMWPMLTGVMAGFAEIDNMLRAETVRRGQRQAFQRGKNVTNFPKHLYRLELRDPADPSSGKTPVIISEYVSTVQQVFHRLLAGQRPAEVVQYILSLPHRLGRQSWEVDDLLYMARNPRLKGAVRHANHTRQLDRKTGNRTPVPNAPENVMWRSDDRQKYVEPALWDAVNEKLDRDRAASNQPRKHASWCERDSKNRRSGVWPSDALLCGLCGGKMYRAMGQNSASARFRCSNSLGNAPRCTNWLSVDVKHVTRRLLAMGLEELLAIDGAVDALVIEANRARAEGLQNLLPEQAAQRRVIRELDTKIANLMKAAEAGQQPQVVIDRIRQLEAERAAATVIIRKGELSRTSLPTLTNDLVTSALKNLRAVIENSTAELSGVMRLLIPKVSLIPVEVSGCNKLHLLGEIELRLAAALPAVWQAALVDQQITNSVLSTSLTEKKVEIIVTPLSDAIRLAPFVAKKVAMGQTSPQIAADLGCTEHAVYRARGAIRHLGAGDLVVKRLTQLPNRRRKRAPAKQM